jgi:hypothetical protein
VYADFGTADDIKNARDLKGKIALFSRGGEISFQQKSGFFLFYILQRAIPQICSDLWEPPSHASFPEGSSDVTVSWEVSA